MSKSSTGYPGRNRSYASAIAPKLSARLDMPSILTRSTSLARTVPLVRVPRTLPKILPPGEVDGLLAALRSSAWPDRVLHDQQQRVQEPAPARFARVGAQRGGQPGERADELHGELARVDSQR